MNMEMGLLHLDNHGYQTIVKATEYFIKKQQADVTATKVFVDWPCNYLNKDKTIILYPTLCVQNMTYDHSN